MEYSNWTDSLKNNVKWKENNPDTRSKMAELQPEKAKKILKDKTVHGKALTPKQKRFMGWVAGGRKPRSAGDKKAGKAMGTR